MIYDDLITDVLTAGTDDWVPADQLLWTAREHASGEPTYTEVTRSVLHALLSRNLMFVGGIGESGFEPWEGDADALTERAVHELESFGWNPQGGSFWLSLTEQGRSWLAEHDGGAAENGPAK
ncbi:hypothetical protein ACGFX7_21435 [Streptomyces harbinensis]|uniref:hypothetical protein n=1 Tax=Streptomyces harbinensis TaxID=1176198 RepID=UPI00371C7BD6